jgi:hypothetical protein
VRRAQQLANAVKTPVILDELRRTMRARLGDAAVCDLNEFARDIEEKYQRMLRRGTSGH